MKQDRRPSTSSQHGFSLLEIIIVLGLMGGVMAMVLSGLTPTLESGITKALRHFSSTTKGAFDESILTGRSYRVALNMSQGEYWLESAPVANQLAPAEVKVSEEETLAIERLKEEVALAMENREPKPEPDEEGNDQYWGLTNALQEQQQKSQVLDKVKWSEVKGEEFPKRALPSNVAFSQVSSQLYKEPVKYKEPEEFEQDQMAYIYFFPWAEATETVVELQYKVSETELEESFPIHRLLVMGTTGQIRFLPLSDEQEEE